MSGIKEWGETILHKINIENYNLNPFENIRKVTNKETSEVERKKEKKEWEKSMRKVN